ncbi:MAG TPA: PAS domain S-box protein, partial [Anaerolineaceae bacterium]|nr:PAS domain S-box protein [Anaerolineaceae bacterium]
DAIIATDADLNITAFNHAAEAMYGWAAEQALGGGLFEVMQMDPRSLEINEALRQMRLTGRSSGTFVHHHRSGRAIQIESNGIALHDSHGQITGFAFVNRDVTEQKKVQQELVESRRRITEILESISDGFFTLSRDWRFIYVNHRAAWQFGFEPEDLIHQNIWAAVQQLADSPVERLCRQTAESGEAGSTLAYNSFCDSWFELRAYPTAEGGIAVYTIDKTEARQHELERERLLTENQRQKHLLERLLAETPAGIAFTAGPDHRYVLVNPAYRQLARSQGELVGRTVAEVWTAAADEILPLLDRVYQGEMIHAQEMPIDVLRDGKKETIYVTFTYTPLQDDDGSVEGTLILATEVTDQVQARRMIEAERARLQAVFLHAPEGLIVTDEQARVLLTNPVAEQLLGRPIPLGAAHERQAELNICHPDGTPYASRDLPLTRAALDGEAAQNVEVLVRWPNGKKLNLLLNAGPILGQDQAITGAVAVLQDITERKQMEEALRASEAKIRRLVDSNLIGILYGSHGQITEANDAFLNLVGYTRDELVRGQLFWRALTPPEYLELDEQRSQEAIERGACTPYEKEFIHKDGHRIPVLIGYALLSELKHEYVAFILDLTERKQAESNARFLADLGQRMISVFDPEKRLKVAVSSLGRYLRAARCLLTELDPAEDRLTIRIDYARDLPSCAGEHRLSEWPKGLVEEFQGGRLVAVTDLAADERTRPWYESFYQPLGMRAAIYAPRLHAGQWVATLVISSAEPREWHADELALVRSAADLIWLSLRNARLGADLAESQRRLDLALKNSSLVVYTLDRELNCTWIYNPQKDFQSTAVLGKQVEHILPLEDVADLVTLQRSVLETGSSAHGEFHGRDREGTLRFYDVTLEPLRSEGNAVSGLAVSVMDVSGMRRLEQEILENTTQLEIQRQILRHRELERVEIARDLHDGPLQDLIALSFSLTDALEITEKSDRLMRLDALQQTIQRQIRELRSFCSELRPPALAPFGLERAILSHADAFRTQHPHIRLDFDLNHDGLSLDDDLRLTLYRIYQELMTNVARHSEASAVTVRLWLDEDEVTLVVEDNGRGFTLAENWLNLARQGHLGLVGVRERAESVGGTVKLFSTPGEGATVMVTAPRTVQRD